MVQDVSSRVAGAAIDLLSEAGVVSALARIRQGALTVEEKRELRDLVFAYTNSGGDPGLRTDLEARLASIVLANPAASPNSPTSTPSMNSEVTVPTAVVPAPAFVATSGFAGARPVPQFVTVGTKTTAPVPAPAQSQVVATPARVVADTLPVSAPAIKTSAVPVAAPVAIPVIPPVVSAPAVSDAPKVTDPIVKTTVPESTPTPTETVTPHTTFSSTAISADIIEEKLRDVAPVPTGPVVEMKPLYVEDGTIETYRKRIGEIKSLINTQVGNPVNLVDLDNEVGREYMTTLLEAMKAVSGGGGNMATAMQRLESTVVKVQALLKKTKTPEPTPAPTVPVVTPPVAPMPTVPQPSTEVAHSTQPVAVANAVPVRVAGYTTSPASPVVPTPVAIDPVTHSAHRAPAPVAAATPLRTPADLPTAAEMKARSGITDPLLDPDVDTGLEQLLSEWSLFKKSGIFGTGPHGRQHPLFLKLAPLAISLIVVGRFEGATPEVRQSISDYMNGWRYEQGILFENDETFEHYLRRVIRHIIDSQTRRRTA